MNKKAGVIWVDAQGERVMHVITTSSGVGSIETALGNHSNAGVVECWEGVDEFPTALTSVSTYPTVRATAVLTFRDATGSIAKLFLPAPSSAIFMSDGVTVDPSQISDIISSAVGNLISGAGNTVISFVGGELIATKFSGISTVA